MGKKRTMAKAVLTFALSMAGTIAGNFVYHHFKNKRDEKLKQQELDEWNNTIPESVPDVHSAMDETKTNETVWEVIAGTEPKAEEPKDKAEAIWQKLQELERTDGKKPETVIVKGSDDFSNNAEPVCEDIFLEEGIVKPENKKSARNGTLSERESLVLELHEMFGGSMTTKQIAEQTGIGRSTVDRLKKQLVEKGYKTVDGKHLCKSPVMVDWEKADALLNGDKSDKELAEMLGCDKSTVSKRRAKLKADGRLSA